MSVRPTRSLAGEVIAPPSKAHTHRALFAGLLSKGRTTIRNPLSCDDTRATANAISSLGAHLEYGEESWIVDSQGMLRAPHQIIDCGESGVTLRFTIPIASLAGGEVRLRGSSTLMRRPLKPLIETMGQLGTEIDARGLDVLIKGGTTKGGSVGLPGNVSSQFVSGLLLAAPLMPQGLTIELISPLESRGYVSLTIEMLRQHGIKAEAEREFQVFHVAPGQSYRPTEHLIPGDYSSAAFLMAGAVVTGSSILINGLPREESDPDSVSLKVLDQMGASLGFSGGKVRVEGRALKAAKVDISDCPDLGPIIAVLGCYAEGETTVTGARRLRYKESDRLAAITSELKKLGAAVEERDDGLVVSGRSSLRGGTVESHGDHRIAMALAVAGLGASESVLIRGAQCVNKSYPTFFDDLRSLGADVVER